MWSTSFVLAFLAIVQCSAFLPSPVLSTSAMTPAAQGRASRCQSQTLKMATDSMEERKQKMMDKAKDQMSRRAMMRPKKTYRAPITYPRTFTPKLREAQKKLIDSPEMEEYMKTLAERGYMVEIKGKAISLEGEGGSPAPVSGSSGSADE